MRLRILVGMLLATGTLLASTAPFATANYATGVGTTTSCTGVDVDGYCTGAHHAGPAFWDAEGEWCFGQWYHRYDGNRCTGADVTVDVPTVLP